MPSPISPAKAARENLSYRDRVMRLRRSYDLFPWVESYKKVWTPTNSAGDPPQQYTFQHKAPRSLFISELMHNNGATGAHSNGDWSISEAPWEAQLTTGISGEALVSSPVNADQLLGTARDEVKRFPTGLRIPANDVFSVIARTPPDGRASLFDAGYEHSLSLAMRGYQTFKKGTNVTPQFTYSEYAQQGYRSEIFSPAVSVAIPNNSTAEVLAEFPLTQLHAVDYISVRFNSTDISAPSAILLKLEPPNNRPMMEAACSMALLGSPLTRTAWFFPQPLSCAKNGIWRVRARSLFPINWGLSLAYGSFPRLDVVLHGHNLIREG